MDRTVVIDCFPESVRHYREGYALVAIDVIRATTTAVTAVNMGRRCFPAPSIEIALPLAARLNNPLLVGELGGNMPYGFDMNNSPAEMAHRDDLMRPMILLSSSGTQHNRVAVIGAGTRGEFREEDQMCCAWIAEGLMKAGYNPEDEKTKEIVTRWSGAPVQACSKGNSAEYLRNSGQARDLEFILSHVDDISSAFMVKHDEVVRIPVPE
ncbi:MAG: 2-phosphosulfolactate phosphatase [Ignavibacteria bacterium]|nr:MAG: 2-phosphosulfolactate phosphatase [Ignavibacteria bacterium]